MADTSQFEKVFVINLPSRSDKLDAIRLAADLTGFDVEVIKGVDGRWVSDKALSGVNVLPDISPFPADQP